MRKLFILFLVCLLTSVANAQKASDLIKVSDMLRIKQAGNVILTNDGSKAAFTVNSIVPDPANKLDYKYNTQIYFIYTNGNSPAKQLTTSKEGSSQPAWSPDGKQLAFVRVVDTKPQVFILSMDGGEPFQLTNYIQGASNPKWSPDGKRIVFSSGISLQELLKDSILNPTHAVPAWPFEKPGFTKNEELRALTAKPNPDGSIAEIRAYLNNNEIDKKAKVLTKLNFQEETNVSSDLNFTHYFIIDAVAGAKPKPLTQSFYSFNTIDFTPDGKHLIISAGIDSVLHPDRALEDEIYIANADGSNLRLLLGRKGKSFSSAKVSPTGKWLAFQSSNVESVEVPQLYIMPLNGSEKDTINLPLDRNKSNITWSNDEKYIYLIAQSNGGAPLYRIDVKTKRVEQLSDYNSGIISFDLKNNKLVYAKTEVLNPSELYAADATLKNSKAVTSLNEWVKEKKLSVPEKHTFTNDKGMTVEYWVMKPTNYQAGKKYPLLLDIHGGPSAMWGPGEASMWHEFQFFCSQGYGVVYSNPRGSGGYGVDFLRGNVKDWGTGPTSDVLTALDETTAEGWADTSKLVVSGGSYAGYLVAWIIAHDHRFKAACSQRGVYDLATFFGEGNAWRLVPNYFGGYPWEPKVKELLARESPITYVQNITTPYIIFHGESDRRTGFVQGEMLYRSLKVLGRPVEYVRHPGATHELTRSGDNRQRIDQMLRTYEFFERWIK
jgi:dipeptidyl aminopeptidase/acylaminoacyl peptidase